MHMISYNSYILIEMEIMITITGVVSGEGRFIFFYVSLFISSESDDDLPFALSMLGCFSPRFYVTQTQNLPSLCIRVFIFVIT